MLLLPLLLLLGVMVLYAMGSSFYISLTDVSLFHLDNPVFTGIGNYVRMAQDPSFWNSLRVTGVFTASVTLLQIIVGFTVGFVLYNTQATHRKVYMVLMLSPILIPPIVSATMWRLILYPQVGVFNYIVSRLGIPPQPWLGEQSLALPTMVFLEVWRGSPIPIILFLAGFLSMPLEPLEAAVVDGATLFQRLRYVIIPLMKRIGLMILLLRLVETSKTFDLVWGLTQGGPGESTFVLSIFAYLRAFGYYEIGYGSAIAYVIFILIGLIGVLYVRLVELE